MEYLKPTFSLPATTKPSKLTQTEWEIRVGLRTPDGKLIQPKSPEPKGDDRVRGNERS